MYAAQMLPACENILTRAADTTLDLTEFEFAEHHDIEIAHVGGCPSITVNMAYVPQTSIWEPFHHRKGIKPAKFHIGVIANANARWLKNSEIYVNDIMDMIVMMLYGIVRALVLNVLNPKWRRVNVMYLSAGEDPISPNIRIA